MRDDVSNNIFFAYINNIGNINTLTFLNKNRLWKVIIFCEYTLKISFELEEKRLAPPDEVHKNPSSLTKYFLETFSWVTAFIKFIVILSSGFKSMYNFANFYSM